MKILKNKKTQLVYIFVITLIAFLFATNFITKHDYGKIYITPTYKPIDGCAWVQESFSKTGISFLRQSCQAKSSWNYIESANNTILRSDPGNQERSLLMFRLYTKEKTQNPIDVMNEWYNTLSFEQKQNCEISIADEPLDNFQSEAPCQTPHKTRYKIDLRSEITHSIFETYQGLPPPGQFDYLCGEILGSKFNSTKPYFEFDERSPEKYLFVGSRGNDGSVLIDFNSIQF